MQLCVVFGTHIPIAHTEKRLAAAFRQRQTTRLSSAPGWAGQAIIAPKSARLDLLWVFPPNERVA